MRKLDNSFLYIILLALALAACGGSDDSVAPPLTLQSIQVTPTNPSVATDTTKQFTATGIYSDSSTQDLTSSVTWSSSDTACATVDASGLGTSVGVGVTTITATDPATGISGSTDLTVTAAALVSIAVTPTSPSIALGTTQQFTATGTFSNATTQDLTAMVTWSSSGTAVATVSDAGGSEGLATSVAVGTATITATDLATGISSTDSAEDATLTVTAAALVSIAVTPTSPSIALGTTQQFTATGTFSNATTQDLTAMVTWSSSDTAVATVSDAGGSEGLATSVAVGTATITATDLATGISSTDSAEDATLTVTAAAAAGVTLSTVDRGWYDATGYHIPSNTMAVAGYSVVVGDVNGFLVFDLSGVSGTVTDVVLRLMVAAYPSTDASETFTVYDVSTSVATLRAGGSGLTAIHGDLEAGNAYGSFTVTSADVGRVVDITLNAQAIADINAATGGLFALGVSMDTSANSVDELAVFADGADELVINGGGAPAMRGHTFSASQIAAGDCVDVTVFVTRDAYSVDVYLHDINGNYAGVGSATNIAGEPNVTVNICSSATAVPGNYAARVIVFDLTSRLGSTYLYDPTYSTVNYTVATTTDGGATSTSADSGIPHSWGLTIRRGGGGTVYASYDFDDGTLQGWTTSGLWHVTTNRSASAPNSVWYADPRSSTYYIGARTNGFVTSPDIALGATPALHFHYFLDTENGDGTFGPRDQLTVHVSTDGGATWTWVDHLPDNSTGFVTRTIDLSAYAGDTVQISIGFDSVDDSINTFEGAYIDNVVLDDCGGGDSGNGTVYTSTDVPKSIPDATSAGVDSVLVVSGGTVSIADVNVSVNITHTWDDNLILTLTSPAGTSVILSNRRGRERENYTRTTFDDAALTPISSGIAPFTGSFIPEQALSAFVGQNANGTWTLNLSDNANGNIGTLDTWSIEIQ